MTMIGYKGEMLRAQYHEDKVRALWAAAPVTVAHTRKRQEALTATTTHRKKFFVTGGEHITSDDMFKSAEIVRRNADAVKVEKDKKWRLDITRGAKPRSPCSIAWKMFWRMPSQG